MKTVYRYLMLNTVTGNLTYREGGGSWTTPLLMLEINEKVEKMIVFDKIYGN